VTAKIRLMERVRDTLIAYSQSPEHPLNATLLKRSLLDMNYLLDHEQALLDEWEFARKILTGDE
jgi:hypothetical protein